MHLDVHQLRDFYYRSQLGRAAQKGVRDRIIERWGNTAGLTLVGYGFAVPLLRPFLGIAERVIGLMPGPQGVMHWPADGANHSVLCDEARWPLANDSVDRLVVMHGLETSDHPLALLDEMHRVLSPQGRALIVVPARGGLWARSDATPFGFGRPYSRGQLERLMSDAGFVCAAHTSALFFPPSARRFWLRSARAMEKAGRNWGPDRLGGVMIVEAMRRDTAAPRGLRVTERAPLRVLEGIPVSGAQPAWSDAAPPPASRRACT
ncbi:MAG: methyltransferase domain-containing protein [Rhodobacteraceae bacterium]|nr:methyltransferase domain-containing protein [Paracoccaceae bacterium]